MLNRQINSEEYKIVADCLLAMWMDNRLKDSEYYSFMDVFNVYAKDCGIREQTGENK